MPEIDGSPIQISQTHEAEHTISPYGGIERLSQWIETSLDLTGAEAEFPDPNRGIATAVANRVGDCLPIQSGRGHATIPEQLQFWENNQPLFTTAFENRQSAAALIVSRGVIIKQKRTAQDDLFYIRQDIAQMKYQPTDSEEYSEQLAQYIAEEQQLSDQIDSFDSDLQPTNDEFNANKKLLAEISSRIDCKLPTVIVGNILQKHGWEVGLVYVNHPEHPILFASKRQADTAESQFLIDFTSTPSTFRSDPTIERIKDPRQIRVIKGFAKNSGFISDQDQWPLPFTEETFKRFDDWYVSHTPQETSPNQ